MDNCGLLRASRMLRPFWARDRSRPRHHAVSIQPANPKPPNPLDASDRRIHDLSAETQGLARKAKDSVGRRGIVLEYHASLPIRKRISSPAAESKAGSGTTPKTQVNRNLLTAQATPQTHRKTHIWPTGKRASIVLTVTRVVSRTAEPWPCAKRA